VPSLAQEAHADAIDGVVESVIQQSGVAFEDLDAVAVTIGPGLSLCLKVGVQKARQIAYQANLPVIPCHHMEAHALVARMGNEDSIAFPFLCLLVSGGHNLLVLALGVGNYMQVCLITTNIHLNPLTFVPQGVARFIELIDYSNDKDGKLRLQASARGGMPSHVRRL
jgi:tRNA A37 threonylcarbamoyltransferase TsaD